MQPTTKGSYPTMLVKPIFTLFVLLSVSLQELNAQRYDNTWYLGYPGGNENYGATKVTFNDGSFHAFRDTSFFRGFIDNNAVISDVQGAFMAAFNGYWVTDASGKVMQNGDSIWIESLPYLYGYSDDDLPQGGMFLPWPDHPDSIVLFYSSQGNAAWPVSVDLASLNLFYALIQKSGNDGKGMVVERRNTVINDTIQYGRLSAVRHANGRDWWILVNERFSNKFYRLLLDPEGIHKLDSQLVSFPIIDGLGQANFSPDGSFYAIKNSVGANIGNEVDIFRFDRCSGYLSNQIQIHHDGSSLGGLAFSPNSKYLYVSFRTELFQYDMSSDDIDATKVLVGTYIPSPTGPSPTFYTMQLAPDNKIYMCATNGIKYLHVINNPDEYGINCHFQERGISLPTFNSFSVSYSPYFRLGPSENTICDSLGLDNNPVAWYRYEQDTFDLLKVSFYDLSYFEPQNWSWNFGDGSSESHERFPLHSFDSIGVYDVCLTVDNANSSSTHCKTLYLGVSALNNPVLQSQIVVSPNPFQNILTIDLSASLRSPDFRLYNQFGRLVGSKHLSLGITEFDTDHLPPGIYFWEIFNFGERVKMGKLVKVLR